MARNARPDTVSSNGQKTELCSAQSFEKKNSCLEYMLVQNSVHR